MLLSRCSQWFLMGYSITQKMTLGAFENGGVPQFLAFFLIRKWWSTRGFGVCPILNQNYQNESGVWQKSGNQATCQCSSACRRLAIGVYSIVVKLLQFTLDCPHSTGSRAKEFKQIKTPVCNSARAAVIPVYRAHVYTKPKFKAGEIWAIRNTPFSHLIKPVGW